MGYRIGLAPFEGEHPRWVVACFVSDRAFGPLFPCRCMATAYADLMKAAGEAAAEAWHDECHRTDYRCPCGKRGE